MKKIPSLLFSSVEVKALQGFHQLVAFSLVIVILTFAGCSESQQIGEHIPRSTPAEEGVDPSAILSFLNEVDSREGIDLHSFMMVRHGKVVAEGWWYPYAEDLKHTLYSTSKSFTSTAIGFAVHEGLLSVDDPVFSFFPDKLPDTVPANLEAMKVKHLLTMSAGQDPEPTFSALLPSDDWVEAFLDHPVPKKPGTVFLYNSAATYMLSAIITKVTGETVLEYLKPRLFEPLQISGMDWEVDPNGVNVGGWGLRVKTEDMAKFGLLYLQEGKWNGEQVVPREWVEEATSMHILQHPELNDEQRNKSDWLQGYGYKFWRSRHQSYRADGAYGQYILILPEKDAVIAITAEVDNMQEELDLVWEYLLPAMKNRELSPDKEMQEKLEQRLSELKLNIPEGEENATLETELSGNTFLFEGEGVSEKVTFRFYTGKCEVVYAAGENVSYGLKFGQEEWLHGETDRPGANLLPQPDQKMADMLPFKVAGHYRWVNDHVLELTLRYIESPHAQYFQFDFDDDQVDLKMWESRPGRERVTEQTGNLVE